MPCARRETREEQNVSKGSRSRIGDRAAYARNFERIFKKRNVSRETKTKPPKDEARPA